MKKLITLGLLLICCSVQAQGTEQRKNSLNVQLDGRSSIIEYRLWSGHPYVRMKDTYRLGWIPYLDPVHQLADLAQCVRLEFASMRVVGVWTSPDVRGATLGGELPRLPVPTRTIQYEMWLPVDSVAQLMGYKVAFDAKKQLLSLTSYPDTDDLTIPGACQKSIRSNR